MNIEEKSINELKVIAFDINQAILKNQNLVVQSGDSIKITSQGRIFSDRIASDLFFD
jgi:coproporphyrinogen III oxidase-like Fe-S oxidoreductase